MITRYSDFQAKEFSCQVPDVEFSISRDRAHVVVTVSKTGDEERQIFDEHLYPDNASKIKLQDLDMLLEPYADMWLKFSLTVMVTEEAVSTDGSGNEVVSSIATSSWATTVISCRANILNMTAADWCDNRFLTLIDGAKTTAPGFLEYLYFVGNLPGSPTYKAYYDDDSSQAGPLNVTGLGDGYGRIDASPNNFLSSGRKLLRYDIRAGNRVQQYVVDNNVEPEVAPVLLFWNSFGVQELAYCTGRPLRS